MPIEEKKGEEESKTLAVNDIPDIRSLPGREERVLISNLFGKKLEGWHPDLGEFDLKDPSA